LAPHRRQIARDAAVVADELPLILVGVLDVRVMNEGTRGFPARRAQPALQRFPVLADEEAVFEADVDVAPPKARAHRDRSEVVGWRDAFGAECLLPELDLQLVFPGIEACATPIGTDEDASQLAITARENALEPARPAVVHPEIDALRRLRFFRQPALLFDD